MMSRSSSHLDHLGLHVVALPQTRAAYVQKIPDPLTSFAACDNERRLYVCRSSTVHIGLFIIMLWEEGAGRVEKKENNMMDHDFSYCTIPRNYDPPRRLNWSTFVTNFIN